jgi:predicted nucleic acid-binding protein
MRRIALAIYVDANVPIYAGGGAHPLKGVCTEVLDLVSQRPSDFITSAEVLQELIHVYLSRRIWPAGRVVFDGFAELMTGYIESVLPADARAAADLADEYRNLGGRDLVHVAVMSRLGVSLIVSADTGFDTIRSVQRLDPGRFPEWRESVGG